MGSDFNRRKNGENLKITKSWENDAGVKWQKMNFMPITAPDLFPSKKKQIYRFYWEKVFSAPSTATLMKLKSFVVRKFETTRWKKGQNQTARVDVQVRFGRTIKTTVKCITLTIHRYETQIHCYFSFILLVAKQQQNRPINSLFCAIVLCKRHKKKKRRVMNSCEKIVKPTNEVELAKWTKKTQHWVSPWHIATLGWLSSDSHELFT